MENLVIISAIIGLVTGATLGCSITVIVLVMVRYKKQKKLVPKLERIVVLVARCMEVSPDGNQSLSWQTLEELNWVFNDAANDVKRFVMGSTPPVAGDWDLAEAIADKIIAYLNCRVQKLSR